MKRKALTFALTGMLAMGSLIPIAAKAAETWDYGYNKSTMQWYNYYYHTGYKHYGTITKNGVTYYGPVANAGYWSKLNLDYNGPYAASYNKHILLY
ncbi:hypothetical protein G3A_16830 [Bacillus sp. 17376]|uniref:Bacteriocin n=1 Tax=Mesobacillus boroniphilus JCM 21738 TaxID=1294265 RepID=W4RVA0_9BACI|nr:hypothetical protein [Mesobacillus boroniphilus]ESU31420.1 hypothetical protein G3A_16830 [Bacillus sp. 17376]GAE48231.1 hypothetical protein JCM21738_5319 [Mesobacillus boroniphilus JCM 21738]